MRKQYLVVGASGLIGGSIFRLLRRRGDSVVGTYHNNPIPNGTDLDIEQTQDIVKLMSNVRPNVVFVAAGESNVDRCERDPATQHLNVRDTCSLIRIANNYGAKAVFFSSGYVFDGSQSNYVPDDAPNPLNLYGSQKLQAEIATLKSHESNLIVRTVGVFGLESRRKNFVYKVIDSLSDKKIVYVPNDQWISPIYVNDLAQMTINLVDHDACGIYHVVGNQNCTKEFFARMVAKEFGLKDKDIIGIPSDEMDAVALRPKVCIMSHGKSRVDIPYPDLTDGLRRFRHEV